MSFFTSIRRVIKSGFFNFWRNGFVTLASVLVMTATLFVFGSIIFFGAVLNASLDAVKDKVDINVYFTTDASEARIIDLKESVETLPEVERVTYVSRDDVLEDFRRRHESDEFTLQALDELDENPLGATLNIKAKEPSQYGGIAEFLETREGDLLNEDGESVIDKINYNENEAAINKLSRIIDSAETIGFVITIALVVISVLITFNTIRLAIYISREEISVMRLVGASKSYIRGPFVMTGLMYGFFSAILTLIIFYPVTLLLADKTEGFFVGLDIFQYFMNNFGEIFLIIVGSGVAIGAVSSYWAVKKYLKV